MVFLFCIIPCFFAVKALETGMFIYKAGIPALCIIICLIYYFSVRFLFKTKNRKAFNILLFGGLLEINESSFYQMKKRNNTIFFVVVALVFSIVGDYFLSFQNYNTCYFLFGIVFAFLTHVGCILYMLSNGKLNKYIFIIVAILYSIYFTLRVLPENNSVVLIIALIAYLLISCIALSAAFGLRVSAVSKIFAILAISLVLFSDILIAEDIFADNNKYSYLMLPTYYAALISFTLSCLFLNSKKIILRVKH